MKAAPACQNRIGHDPDRLAPRKQRRNRRNPVDIMGRSENRHDHRMGRHDKVHIACRLNVPVPFDPPGRGHFDHFDAESARPRGGIGIDRGVGIVRPGRARQRQPIGRDKPGQIVDMAIGVIVDQPLAQPQHPVKAEIARQPHFEIGARQMRIAIGIEQALFGRRDQPGAIAIERPAFEHPVGARRRQTDTRGKIGADCLIPRHQVFPAPAVEAEQPRGPCARAIMDHQRPGIAQPDIAIDAGFQHDTRSHQTARARRIGRIAHDQPHLLPAVGDGIGKGGDLFLRAIDHPAPFVGNMRKTDPQQILRVPFGGHASCARYRHHAAFRVAVETCPAGSRFLPDTPCPAIIAPLEHAATRAQ